MSTGTHFVSLTLTTLYCANCHVLFGIPSDMETRRREDHEAFYCPSGHANFWTQKSALEKARDQLARETHRAEQAQEDARRQRERWLKTERRLSAQRGQVTRIKNRIAKGICPCCNRTFANLARHMAGQHPAWTLECAEAPADAR